MEYRSEELDHLGNPIANYRIRALDWGPALISSILLCCLPFACVAIGLYVLVAGDPSELSIGILLSVIGLPVLFWGRYVFKKTMQMRSYQISIFQDGLAKIEENEIT